MARFPAFSDEQIERRYTEARELYGHLGVDTDAAIDAALGKAISLHCWQADDVTGFEPPAEAVEGGGILATGDFPGRARNADELRQDIEQVLRLLPGEHRLNLHAMYAETGGERVDRDALQPGHFARWMDWGRENGVPLDFNTTFFAHPKANDGCTLSHEDEGIRSFWQAHGVACRRIAQAMGERQGSPCILNHWMPDGMKDLPADRWSPRGRLVESLDAILDEKHGIDTAQCRDAVESKLFGLGSEAYVVGSMEFYSSYALSRGILLCLDMGHYHPTETIDDKLSALMQFHDQLLIHTSRPMRWDSDHVVTFNDDVRNVFLELARGGALDRMVVALDFFDASIDRIGAYVIGTRATRKAMLYALCDPTRRLQEAERAGRWAERLALMEESKTLPFGAVWDMCCRKAGVPAGTAWLPEMEEYERTILSARAG